LERRRKACPGRPGPTARVSTRDFARILKLSNLY
jgi:hypothetical protein